MFCGGGFSWVCRFLGLVAGMVFSWWFGVSWQVGLMGRRGAGFAEFGG